MIDVQPCATLCNLQPHRLIRLFGMGPKALTVLCNLVQPTPLFTHTYMGAHVHVQTYVTQLHKHRYTIGAQRDQPVQPTLDRLIRVVQGGVWA